MLKRVLLQAEKIAPTVISRVWGLWHDPLAEVRGLQVTQLTETKAEVTLKNPEGSPSRFLEAAELAIGVLWRRHLRGGLEKVNLTQCNFETLGDVRDQHFVARTELLENDREKVLKEARSIKEADGGSGLESLVLIFDRQNRLVAQTLYTVKIKSLLSGTETLVLTGGN